jgi:DNA-binding transcriptional LysR family regulator
LRLDGDRLLLVVSAEHPLARSHQPLRELHRHRYLARGQGSATETLARRLLGTRYAAGPVANVQRGAVQQALLSGIGYAVMPAMVVESHVTAGRLHVIDLPGRSVEQPITAVRREEDSSPALDAWWTYLTQERRTKQARGTPRKAGSATRRC